MIFGKVSYMEMTMEKIRLGKTDLYVTRTAFGALPIQRVGFDEAARLLQGAYDAGVNFFDTARGYSDSEEKIGRALKHVRDEIVIATKSGAGTAGELTAHLETSLAKMQTDYVDILQLHNPRAMVDPDDVRSPYAGAVRARDKGLVRHVGISNHRLDVALEAARSGLFATMQFPLSVISAEKDFELIEVCRQNDLGFIAMKAMAGGLIRNTRAAFAFFRQFDNVVPIWGIQREEELEEFLALEAESPAFDDRMKEAAEAERQALAGDFCRGCGYCLPCPVEIPLNLAARMSLLIRRAPSENLLTEEWRARMERIELCTDCGQCRERCPYELDPAALSKKNLEDYRTFFE